MAIARPGTPIRRIAETLDLSSVVLAMYRAALVVDVELDSAPGTVRFRIDRPLVDPPEKLAATRG